MLCLCRENRGRPTTASAWEPNTLTLFEKVSGDLSQVNVQTVTACANAGEGETVEEGAPSTRLGSWKQQRWWRKGRSRGWRRTGTEMEKFGGMECLERKRERCSLISSSTNYLVQEFVIPHVLYVTKEHIVTAPTLLDRV
ncbi:hypothetical protein BHM03_00035356 [Ensete ventricosum]|nr:hypothetical protein BHM03_00035356 [Ensete ventricosum]